MLERKLNLEQKTTDLFKDALGKIYKVKTDHVTMLLVQEIFSKEETDEKDDDKAMSLLLGEENWKEIKEFIENQPNYQENSTVVKIEIFSIAYNVDFEVMASRFQNQLAGR